MKNDFFTRILLSPSFNSLSSHGSMLSFIHDSLFYRAWCPLVVLDPSKTLPKPHLLCSTKCVLCKKENNCLSCSSLIIFCVTFDAVANLAHWSGVTLLRVAVISDMMSFPHMPVCHMTIRHSRYAKCASSPYAPVRHSRTRALVVTRAISTFLPNLNNLNGFFAQPFMIFGDIFDLFNWFLLNFLNFLKIIQSSSITENNQIENKVI